MITDEAKQWLFAEWGTYDPYMLESTTAWSVLKESRYNKNAQAVWNAYAQAKRLPIYSEALKKIVSYEDLLTEVYVKRLRA